MHGLIVRHSLFAKSAAPAQWVLEQLMAIDDDELTEIHLRAKIETADWAGFREAYTWLSAEKQNTDEWRYWRAIAAGPGEAEFAQTTFEQLAEGRGFHAYLAATTLAKPLSLGMVPEMAPEMVPDVAEETITASYAVVERVSELLALGMDWEARTEFRSGLDDPRYCTLLGRISRFEWKAFVGY